MGLSLPRFHSCSYNCVHYSRFQKRHGEPALPGLESCHSQTRLIKSRVPPAALGGSEASEDKASTVNVDSFRARLAVCDFNGSLQTITPSSRGRGPLEGVGPILDTSPQKSLAPGSVEHSSIPYMYRRPPPNPPAPICSGRRVEPGVGGTELAYSLHSSARG